MGLRGLFVRDARYPGGLFTRDTLLFCAICYCSPVSAPQGAAPRAHPETQPSRGRDVSEDCDTSPCPALQQGRRARETSGTGSASAARPVQSCPPGISEEKREKKKTNKPTKQSPPHRGPPVSPQRRRFPSVWRIDRNRLPLRDLTRPV